MHRIEGTVSGMPVVSTKGSTGVGAVAESWVVLTWMLATYHTRRARTHSRARARLSILYEEAGAPRGLFVGYLQQSRS